MYNSLLLNAGGGIITSSMKSQQSKDAGSVIIGLGGTGFRALSVLKQKVYNQLYADGEYEAMQNPDPAMRKIDVKRYQNIQFLEIDSDDTEIKTSSGATRLDANEEFFSIKEKEISVLLKEKTQIKQNPLMDWMDIDQISEMMSPEGAGGVRQIGRYLLLSKIDKLETALIKKINDASTGIPGGAVNVYIIAGISGGTGSGCFLDTCYITRAILNQTGHKDSKIYGLFFLPDVVTSKPAVASKRGAKEYNESNGYAAMKELDYLMNLQDSNEWFEQRYSASMSVKTQDPPCDMCHLISATNAKGDVLPNGFDYCVNVAADYVMAYLAYVANAQGQNDNNKAEVPLTMSGHLANVNTGITHLKKTAGANLKYHIVGAANEEIPMTEIATYLAAGFIDKFANLVNPDVKPLSKEEVKQFIRELGLEADTLQQSFQNGDYPEARMPEMDMDDLKRYGVPDRGKLPRPWAEASTTIADRVEGALGAHKAALNAELPTYDRARLQEDGTTSLLGKIFLKLLQLADNPQYGPFYAASILNHGGYDLLSELRGQIEYADQSVQTARSRQSEFLDYIVDDASGFCGAWGLGRKGKYTKYKQTVEDYLAFNIREKEYQTISDILNKLVTDLQRVLTQGYFKPLTDLLTELEQTFKENTNYTVQKSKEAKKDKDYTIRLLELKDIQEDLDKAIKNLQPNELVTKFIDYLIAKPGEWRTTTDDQVIGRFISTYMQDQFSTIVNQQMQQFLVKKYPKATNVTELTKTVQDDIIKKLAESAEPMFWRDPVYKGDTFDSVSMSVPSGSTVICNAAESYAKISSEFTVRQTGLQDRIFALRFCSGIPFYAYQGVTLMKQVYDSTAGTASGAGAHLYSKTGRGDFGKHDWRTEIPTPMPMSAQAALVPNGEALKELYIQGRDAGIIREELDVTGQPDGNYRIYFLEPEQERNYTIDDFKGPNGEFLVNKWDAERKAVQDRLNVRKANADPNHSISLKNDGDDRGGNFKEMIRIDYFVHYRRYQEAVRQELASRKILEDAVKKLDALRTEVEGYDREVQSFAEEMFFGYIKGLNAEGNPDYAYGRMRSVEYDYEDAYHVAQKEIFAARNDEGAFRDHPLYRAFLHYTAMDPDGEPRRSLDLMRRDRKAETRKAGVDNVIAYQMEQKWTPDMVADLERKVRNGFGAEDAQNIMRFYRTFVANIHEFKSQFTPEGWIKGCVEAETPPVGQAAGGQQVTWTAPKAGGDTWTCPVCGKEQTGMFCPNDGTKKPEPQPAADDDSWICPTCGQKRTGLFCSADGTRRPEKAPDNSWICPVCGEKRDGMFCPKDGTKRPAAAPEAPAFWFCPNCGTKNTDMFCQNCGTKKA